MGGTFASPEKGRLIVGKTYKLKHPKCYLHFYQDTQEWHIYHRPPFATAKVVSLSKLPQGIDKELTGEYHVPRSARDIYSEWDRYLTKLQDWVYADMRRCKSIPESSRSAYFSSSHHDKYFGLNEI